MTWAVISWDHELDALINPHLVEAPGQGAFLDPLVPAGCSGGVFSIAGSCGAPVTS